MNKEQAKAREIAIKAVHEAWPHLTLEQATKLQDKLFILGRKCNQNATDLCNIANYADKHDALRAEADKLFKKYGIEVEYSVTGDPRGFCLKVMLPSGAYNSWGGAECGWGW